jgi:hypothetical protein
MPGIRDQDSAPFCNGFAVQQIFQHLYCKDELNNDNCSNLDPKNEMSPLSVMARCIRNISEEEFFKDKEKHSVNMKLYKNSSKTHKNLVLNDEGGGCDTRSLTYKLYMSPAVNSEECYPFDQFANRFPPPEKFKEYNEQKEKIEKLYDKYRIEGSACNECLQKFEEEVRSFLYPNSNMKSPSSAVLLEALRQESYNKMWFYLFNQDNCKSRIAVAPRDIHVYPIDRNNRTEWINSYDKAINIIKEAVVKNKKPIAVGLCVVKAKKIDPTDNRNCGAGHSITIAGYDNVCKYQNGKRECREVVKIYNSWGERSYGKNSDGSLNMWYDAKSLFKNIGPGAENTVDMSWIE